MGTYVSNEDLMELEELFDTSLGSNGEMRNQVHTLIGSYKKSSLLGDKYREALATEIQRLLKWARLFT